MTEEPKEQDNKGVAHLFPAQDDFVAGSYFIQEQDPMDTLHPFNYGVWLLVGPIGDQWSAILDYEKSREYSGYSQARCHNDINQRSV